MNQSRISISLLALITLLWSTDCAANGERTSVAGLSMARNFVASARGLEAIGTNPANLALGDNDRTVTFTFLPSFGLNFGSDFIHYDIYNDYFTGVDTGGGRIGRYLSDTDKENILTLFPDGIAETHAEIELRLFGLTIHTNTLGSLGFAITERMAFQFDLPRDYARFAFYLLDTTGYVYDFSGTDVRGWWLRDYSLSYARMLPDFPFVSKLAAGLTLKLVHGFGYVGTDHYSAQLVSRRDASVLSSYRIEGSLDFLVRRSGIDAMGEDGASFSPFPAPAGTGFGVDFGLSGELLPGVRAAMSITDIGSISWTRNIREQIGKGSFSITKPNIQAQRDSAENAIKGDQRDGEEFSTPLPTALRIGGSLRLDETGWTPWIPGTLLVALEYHQGFNKAPGNTTRPRLAMGLEYRFLKFLPIRTGLGFGGLDRFNWAFGFGLDFGAFTFDLGTENFAMLFTPNSFDQFSLGMAMRVKI